MHLLINEQRAAHIKQIVRDLPKPLMQHERAVFDLLVDRETLLRELERLTDLVDILREERDNARIEATVSLQHEMAHLRGTLAMERAKRISRC
jgi:hypothetical protein